MKKKSRKIKFKSAFNKSHALLFAAVFVVIGVITLISSIATASITIDSSLPKPQNVQAFGDDKSIILTWEGNNDSRVVGYDITYRIAGSNDEYTVRQQEAKKTQWSERPGIIQLQPLVNGQEYEINIQSASGTIETYDRGPLVSGAGNSQVNRFARADGKVSNKASISSSPTSARVDAMRQKYTVDSNGFFDDFNYAAGPFNELKWNNAANSCVQPGTAAAFVNAQFHAHNMARSDGQCDRAGIASRPRAVFDMTGSSESSPAELAIDIDGVTHNRDTWYLDVIPMDSRNNGLPVDITSHNDINDNDVFGPGNMIRINARGGLFSLAYYDTNQNPRKLNLFEEGTSCGQTYRGNTTVSYTSCDFDTKKTGISPIQESTYGNENVANVRRNWVIRFSGDKIRIYINSTFVGSAILPQEFVAKNKYQVHSTLFSYNTGKETKEGVIPYVELLHWDNLGFTAPAGAPKQDVVFNYLEGQETGDTPVYSTGTPSTRLPNGNRTTIIPVPEPIGDLKDGKGNFFFTVTREGFDRYNWSPNDHIFFNGIKYDVPSMRENAGGITVQENYVGGSVLFAYTMQINKEHIVQGDNVVQFVLNGDSSASRNKQADTFNVHLELPYTAAAAQGLSYSQPIDIFREQFLDIVQPAITSCDFYRVIEKDLGLPYQSGQGNIQPGPCEFLETHAAKVDDNPGDHNPVPTPAPDPVCEDSTAINTGDPLPCDYPEVPLPEPETGTADWEKAVIGISQPQVNIADSVYPNSLGVQFFYNGQPDDRDPAARPNGFDATGPREDSQYHIYPDLTLSEGDTLEARWTDLSGVIHRNVITIGSVSPDPDSTGSGECSLAGAVFCEDFENGPSSGTSRNGDWSIDRFSFSRWKGGLWEKPGLVESSPIPACRSGLNNVLPPNDALICDSTSTIASSHGLIAAAAQNYGDTLARIAQPFNFDSRTGIIQTDLTMRSSSLEGWPTFILSATPEAHPSYRSDNVSGSTPQNGLRVDIRGRCMGSVYQFIDHVEQTIPVSCTSTPIDSATNLSRMQLRVSNNKIEMWSSDPSNDGVTYNSLQKRWEAPISLPFSEASVTLGTHNHATEKYGSRLASWDIRYDNIAFDGPLIETYTVAQVESPNTSVAEGVLTAYEIPSTVSVVLDPSEATSAQLTFNMFAEGLKNSNVAVDYRVNGNSWKTLEDDGVEGPFSYGYITNIPVNELINGNNNIEFRHSLTGIQPFIGNVDIIMSGGAVDSLPPFVSLTSPEQNAVVSGTVNVTANASDNENVSRVSFYLDDSSTPFSNDSTAPYSVSWNSALTTNGSHTLRAIARDNSGNIASSELITINVSNIEPDTTAPTTTVTSPTNNSEVNGAISIEVAATDNVGLSKVELLLNGAVLQTDLTSPYSFVLDTTLISDQEHELRTRVFDAAGNSTYSDIVLITVNNVYDQPQLCADTTANNAGEPLPCTYNPDPTPDPNPDPTPVVGDADGDGDVDRVDLRIARYYYKTVVIPFTDGDMNGDGYVDRLDLRIILFYYRK